MRFGIRGLLLFVAVIAVLTALTTSVIREWSCERFVIDKVESLNGSVSIDFPQGNVLFSVVGLPPLVTDADLRDLAPYLSKVGVRGISLAATKVTDAGCRNLLAHCHSNLRFLDVSGTSITGKGLESIATCPHLHSLALSKSTLSDGMLQVLVATQALRKIFVFDATAEDDAVKRLCRAVPEQIKVECRRGKHSLDF